MPGTQGGGKAAATTNKAKHGADFYKQIGQLGGRAKVAKGFAVNRELARSAGQKGGLATKKDYKRNEKN